MSKEVAQRGASLTEMEAIYIIARLYARFGDHTEMDKIPIQVYGSNNLPEHQSHIFDSMLGLGSNGRPTSFVLTRVSSEINNRNFLGRKSVCGGYPRAISPNGRKQDCDEYPYNSTLQGGLENYDNGYVSVRLVSQYESRKQGRFIRKFYDHAPVNIGNNFIVIPLGGISGYFDKAWKWHEFN
jgi:hypothetical protein